MAPHPASAASLIREAAERHGVEINAVTGPSQQPHLVPARREVAFALRAQGWSLTRIGRVLGGRHHSAVLYYLGKRKRQVEAAEMRQTQARENVRTIPYPDLSGEWAI